MTESNETAEPSGASGGSQRAALDRLIELAKRQHYYCEDSWYSCPLAEGGCANDDWDKDECSCGASAHNAQVDEIADTLRKLVGRVS